MPCDSIPMDNIDGLIDLADQMLPHIKNPRNYVRRAANEFFRRSERWQYCDEALDVVRTEEPPTHTLVDVPNAGSIIRVKDVFSQEAWGNGSDDYGEYRIPEQRETQQVQREYYYGSGSGYHSDDQYWYNPSPKVLKFNRPFLRPETLRLNVVLGPSADGFVDQDIYNEYSETILNYALYLGHSVPDTENNNRVDHTAKRDAYAMWEDGLMRAIRFHKADAKPYRPVYKRNDRNNANRGGHSYNDRYGHGYVIQQREEYRTE